MIDEETITRAMDACASKGWTDVTRNDAVAEEFSIALEEICSEYNFGRCDDVGATDALVAVTALALGRDASSTGDIVQYMECIARIGRGIESGDVDGDRGTCFVNQLVGVKRVVHCLDSTVSRTANDDIPDSQGTILDD